MADREAFRNEADFESVPTSIIVEMYNAATGKNIKGFHTRTKGIQQTLAARRKAGLSSTPEAAPPTKPKAPAVAKPATTGRRQRTTQPAEGILRVQVSENPKRPSTMAYDQFSELLGCAGQTVQTYLDREGQCPKLDHRKGWPRVELSYCIRAGLVKVEVPA